MSVVSGPMGIELWLPTCGVLDLWLPFEVSPGEREPVVRPVNLPCYTPVDGGQGRYQMTEVGRWNIIDKCKIGFQVTMLHVTLEKIGHAQLQTKLFITERFDKNLQTKVEVDLLRSTCLKVG